MVPQQSIEIILNTIESASDELCAVCALLKVGNNNAIPADAVHTLISPIARKLAAVAGDFSDHIYKA